MTTNSPIPIGFVPGLIPGLVSTTNHASVEERFANSASRAIDTSYDLVTLAGTTVYSFHETVWRHPDG